MLFATLALTVMKIMTEKKYVRRKKAGGNFVYYPRVTEETVTRRMLCDIVDRVFDGSAAAVLIALAFLSSNHRNES